MSLTDEAQHLLNSLEAHFAAVRAAVASADDAVMEHVESAWDEAYSAIQRFERKFGVAGSTVGNGSAPQDSPPASSQAGAEPATEHPETVASAASGSAGEASPAAVSGAEERDTEGRV